jgi:NADH oxidase (H2O2-forming)
MKRTEVIIIGNGIGGFSAASTLRHADERHEVTIISSEKDPLYSACVLPDYIAGKIRRENTFVKKENDYKQLGIRTLFGYEVKEINPCTRKVTLNDGQSLPFERLVLATGSEAVGLGAPKRGIFKLKTLEDADGIYKHTGRKATVVGSGAIGIEVAIALHRRGYEVTVVEMMDQILPLALDHEFAYRVKALLEEHGMKVVLGESAKGALGSDHVEGLRTDKRELECDMLISALGMRPKVDLARAAAIRLGDKGGIHVNSHMETNVPGIYACGDCVETHDVLTGEPALNLFWHNANRQGAVVGRNCAGLATDYPGSQNILNVDIFGHHVVGFGYTESAWRKFFNKGAKKGKPSLASTVQGSQNGGYYRLVMAGDRCVGGQFIDIKKDLGLLWSLMVQKRSIKELLRTLENREMMQRRQWLFRLKPFFV